MPQIDIGPFLKSMESELRSCEAARAGEILISLERWAQDETLNEPSRAHAQRLVGKARFRIALALSNSNRPSGEQTKLVDRLRSGRSTTAPEASKLVPQRPPASRTA